MWVFMYNVHLCALMSFWSKLKPVQNAAVLSRSYFGCQHHSALIVKSWLILYRAWFTQVYSITCISHAHHSAECSVPENIRNTYIHICIIHYFTGMGSMLVYLCILTLLFLLFNIIPVDISTPNLHTKCVLMSFDYL